MRCRALRSALGLACLAGCYSFSGGGGLPSHIRTVFVEPVDNQSTRFGLSESLSEELLDAARQRLGLRLSAEGEADAIIRATIRSYIDDAVSFDAVDGVGADVFQRRVTVSASVEIIDRTRNEIIWSSQALAGTGEYDPEAATEEEGTVTAIENLVQQIVDGAQSQW
ncbi:MAG: LPS assembly lipoprotein LptE [Gemmatimonadota bacterium]|nr:LPS assembly lipoprotein LptE [Gemmatimonadota bacterium]